MTTLQKRFQIFVSSTFKDLVDERNAVTQAIREINHIPVIMEEFPATNETQWEYIKRTIDQCDYYVVILGRMYGSINPDEGISYTEMEFRYAESIGVPSIAFTIDESVKLLQDKIDMASDKIQKLSDFKSYIEGKKIRRAYESVLDLKAKVIPSILNLIETYPRTGWVRADSLEDYTSNTEVIKLMKENEDLKLKLNPIENIKAGEDMIQVKYSFAVIHSGTFNKINYGVGDEYIINMSINDIFFELSKLLYVFQNDFRNLSRVLEDFIGKSISRSLDRQVHISNDEMLQILIQLEALGYISANNSNEGWILTENGRKKYVMGKAYKK